MPRDYETGPQKPPGHLSLDSQQLWREVLPCRISAGRAALLTQALECRDRLQQIRALLADAELVKITPRSGAVHLSPLVKAEMELRRQFGTLWGMLRLEWKHGDHG